MSTYYALDPLAVGDVVAEATPAFPDALTGAIWLKLATPDVLAEAGAPLSIVRLPAAEGERVDIWRRIHGPIPADITGLPIEDGFARVSALGRPEFVEVLDIGDYPIGTVAAGLLTLDPRGPVAAPVGGGGVDIEGSDTIDVSIVGGVATPSLAEVFADTVIGPTTTLGAELATLVAAGKRRFRLLRGDYTLESWPTLPYGEAIRIRGAGLHDTRVTWGGALGSSVDHTDAMIGARGVEVPATLNATPTNVACGASTPYYPPGSYFVSVDNVDSAAPGTWVRLRGQNAYADQESISSPGPLLRWVDLVKIEAINGSTLELAFPTASYHTLANDGGEPQTVVAVSVFEGWVFEDLMFDGANIATGVLIEYGHDFAFRRVGFERFAFAGVVAKWSRRLTFDHCYLGEGCSCLVWGDATHVVDVVGTTTNDSGDRECSIGLSWGFVTVINNCAQWTVRDNRIAHKPVGLLLFGYRDLLCQGNRYDDMDAVEFKVRNSSGLLLSTPYVADYIMSTLGVCVHQGVVSLNVAEFNRRYRDFGTTIGTAWTSSMEDASVWAHDTMMALWQGLAINSTKHPYQNIGGQVRYQLGIRTQDTEARFESVYVQGCEHGFRYNSGDTITIDDMKIFPRASNAGDDFIGVFTDVILECANNLLRIDGLSCQTLDYGPNFEVFDYSMSHVSNLTLNDMVVSGPALFARNNCQATIGMGYVVSLDSSSRDYKRKLVATSHPHAGGAYRVVANFGGFGQLQGEMVMVEPLPSKLGYLFVDESVEVEAGMDIRLVSQVADGTAALFYGSPYGAGPKIGNALNYRAAGLTGSAAIVKAGMPLPSVAGEVIPSPPAAYLPASLSGLVLALDASVGFSSTGIWNDRSTANNDAIQLTSGARPTKQTVDGADAIVFDGVNDDMEGDSVPFGVGFADFTLVLVVKPLSDASPFTIQNATLPSRAITTRVAPTFGGLSLVSDTGQSAETYVGYGAGWHMLVLAVSGGLLRASVDGGAETTTALPSGGFATGSRFRLARWDGVGGYWQGEVREVLGYNRYLDATERGNLRTFLQAKWPGLP